MREDYLTVDLNRRDGYQWNVGEYLDERHVHSMEEWSGPRRINLGIRPGTKQDNTPVHKPNPSCIKSVQVSRSSSETLSLIL